MNDTHVLMLVAKGRTDDARVLPEARSLVDNGYRVTVLGWDRRGDHPDEERLDGIRFVRARNTAWMRTLPLDLLRLRPWWRLARSRGREIHAQDPVDVVHAHDLDTLPAGIGLKEDLGVPLIYDAHEIWGYMVARDLPWPLPAYFRWRERQLLPQVDQVITVNPLLEEYFEGLADIPVTVVMNAKPVRGDAWTPPPEGPFTALYIGHLHWPRFVHGMVEAVAGLDGVRLVVAGSGNAAYVQEVTDRIAETPNATFVGRIPIEEVLDRTLQSHAVLLMDDPDDPNNRVATSNKLFEAMACGRPIVCARGTNDGRIAEEEGVGLVVERDVEALREALVRLRDDPDLQERLGRAGLDAALREYNWSVQAERILALYDRITGGPDAKP